MASVLGRSFSLDELAGLLGRPPLDLRGEIREAMAAGLLTEAGDRLAFRHDLVREAVDASLPKAVRLALIDYQLPDMDGYASARVLRNMADAGGPKLIACTANTTELRARPGVEDLFDGILPKPLNLPSLMRMIENSLGDPQRRKLVDEAARVWRERGLHGRPAAKVVPEPTKEQAIAVGVCFEIVTWAQADLILVTDAVAANSLELIRARSDSFLLPIVDVSGDLRKIADASFSIAATQTWAALATVVNQYARQRARLAEHFRRSSDLDDRLLAYLFVSEKPLTPVVDVSRPSCMNYAGLFPAAEAAAAAERLAKRGLLARKFADRFHACTSCNSHRLNVREECSDCRSPNLGEVALIHHFGCAYQGSEQEFRSGTHLVCPKCRRHLRHYGGDYDKPGSVLRCEQCGSCHSDPAVGFSCLDCGAHMDGDAAVRHDLFSYALTDRAIALLTLSPATIALPGFQTDVRPASASGRGRYRRVCLGHAHHNRSDHGFHRVALQALGGIVKQLFARVACLLGHALGHSDTVFNRLRHGGRHARRRTHCFRDLFTGPTHHCICHSSSPPSSWMLISIGRQSGSTPMLPFDSPQ